MAQERWTVTVATDPSASAINRGLFSVVNYPRSYAEMTPASAERIAALDLSATQFRIETMIDLMEPANDNDDPTVFDWSGLRTEDMFRFLPGATANFYADVEARGGEPVILLTYNVAWLARNGRANDPPDSNAEWAEFAAAVVEHLIGLHAAGSGPFPRYVEVWNEPGPGGPYWTGTLEEYAELFRAVADRIHARYPGVLVGGPSFLADQGVHLMRFLELAGDAADFITIHVYNDDPVLMTRRLERWVEYVEQAAGRPLGLMVTETDNWRLTGPDKFNYILVRQFELLNASPRVLGVHHFSLPYYREAPDRTFGLVFPNGEVLGCNYWPYWYFAPLTGLRMEVSATLLDGSDAPRGLRDPSPLYAAASHDDTHLTVLLYPPGSAAYVNLEVSLPCGSSVFTRATLAAVREAGPETLHEWRLEPGSSLVEISLSCEPGVAYRLLIDTE
jgi:hypothetical protein